MTAAPDASRLASYLSGLGVDAATVERLSPETVAYAAALDVVGRVAPEVVRSIETELADQRANLKLIASENFASPAVLLAMGNWLSDKYAEGSPGHRFYAGCDNVDAIESRAAELAMALFGSDHAYVQPHSGIDANLVAFWSILTHRVPGAGGAPGRGGATRPFPGWPWAAGPPSPPASPPNPPEIFLETGRSPS